MYGKTGKKAMQILIKNVSKLLACKNYWTIEN